MNRAGLAVTLTLAVLVGSIFGFYAQLDLDLAGLFFNSDTHMFNINGNLGLAIHVMLRAGL